MITHLANGRRVVNGSNPRRYATDDEIVFSCSVEMDAGLPESDFNGAGCQRLKASADRLQLIVNAGGAISCTLFVQEIALLHANETSSYFQLTQILASSYPRAFSIW